MRKALVLIFVAVLILSVNGVAYAAGWLATADFPANPHGSYSANTNKCKTCHAVHEATGSTRKLLRAAGAWSGCEVCHASGTSYSYKNVYILTNYKGEHTIGATTLPDSTSKPNAIGAGLDCFDCHSVHGAKIVTGTKILKYDPGRDSGVATTKTGFCADCHNNNYVTTTDGTSHVMKTADQVRAFASSAACSNCHSGLEASYTPGTYPTVTAASEWPHRTLGYNLLMDGYTQTTHLDSVCLVCHKADSTSGVGITY